MLYRLAGLPARENEVVGLESREARFPCLEYCEGLGGKLDDLGACLRIGKDQKAALEIDVAPFRRDPFSFTGPRENRQGEERRQRRQAVGPAGKVAQRPPKAGEFVLR
jgi:hypothetical protein